MNTTSKPSAQRNHRVEIWRVNAFTDVPFKGNPAGVVADGDGLSEEAMLAIAGELNDISETVFICRPDDPGAELRLRYFTTTMEVDLCGHATVSALFTLGWLGRLRGDNETRTVRVQTNVGVLELGLQFAAGEPAWASMQQLPPQTAPAPGAEHAPAILGLPESALSTRFDTGCAYAGLWACFVPLEDVSWLRRIRVDSDRIEELWPDNPELSGIYPFAFVDETTTQGRFFSPPKYGIVEDPVTGTACGALGGYLLAQGGMPGDGELVARQGFEMGRGGLARVSRNANGNMQIRGQAVPVFRGELLA
ncbi:MAG: PhzF family phenazine biosynthesis protein [Lysobacterales bacterium]|jgi:PhzF family phenazine biosynthesis protein